MNIRQVRCKRQEKVFLTSLIQLNSCHFYPRGRWNAPFNTAKAVHSSSVVVVVGYGKIGFRL